MQIVFKCRVLTDDCYILSSVLKAIAEEVVVKDEDEGENYHYDYEWSIEEEDEEENDEETV